MKLIRNVIALTAIVFSTGCTSSDHLEFRGVPINGDLKSFTEELKKMGYQEVQAEEEHQLKFSGRFLDKDSKVHLFTTKKSHTPYMLRVDLPEEAHDSVKYNYERLKKHCESILGPGASKYQQFNSSSRFLFNERGIAKDPKNGDYTRYLGRAGSVILRVNFKYLSITYLDKKNNELSVTEGGEYISLETGM